MHVASNGFFVAEVIGVINFGRVLFEIFPVFFFEIDEVFEDVGFVIVSNETPKMPVLLNQANYLQFVYF